MSKSTIEALPKRRTQTSGFCRPLKYTVEESQSNADDADDRDHVCDALCLFVRRRTRRRLKFPKSVASLTLRSLSPLTAVSPPQARHSTCLHSRRPQAGLSLLCSFLVSTMHTFKPISLLVSAAFLFVPLFQITEASDLRNMDSLEARYARAHSLGNNYHFRARDGWMTVNVTDLQYKYRRDSVEDDENEDEGDTGILDDGSDLEDPYDDDTFELAKRANKNVTFNPPSKAKAKAKTKGQAKVAAAKSSKKTSSKSTDKAGSKSSSKAAKKPSSKSAKGSSKGIASSVKNILASLKGQGKAEPVAITWYCLSS